MIDLDKGLIRFEKNTADEMRGKIVGLEAVMKAMPERHINLELKHHFLPGLYIREIEIPAGATLTGDIHKTEHFCVLRKGKVQVMTDQGMKELTAPAFVHSLPGIKRAMHALEDSIWTNVHYNPENITDLDEIYSHYVCQSYEQFQEFTEQKLLGET